MKRASSLVALLLWAVIALSCPGAPSVSDTGYLGTWSRGDNVRSTLSIYRSGEEYLFRLSLRSQDGKWEIKCGWDGACTEFIEGEKKKEYQFRTWVDPESTHLMLEYVVRYPGPVPRESHYIDELVLEPTCLALRANTVERDGTRFEPDARPSRRFEKVSDEVAFPPRAGS